MNPINIRWFHNFSRSKFNLLAPFYMWIVKYSKFTSSRMLKTPIVFPIKRKAHCLLKCKIRETRPLKRALSYWNSVIVRGDGCYVNHSCAITDFLRRKTMSELNIVEDVNFECLIVISLSGWPLKLQEKFAYIGRRVRSTKNNVDIRQAKARTAIDRLSILWKSDISDKRKRGFFQALAESILLYGCTMQMLTNRIEKKLDRNYTKMLQAIVNKSL